MTSQRSSSVPYVKARLVDLFANETATAGRDGKKVQTSYGWPKTPEREVIWVGDVAAPAGEEWIALGASRREQEYYLAVTIDVRDPANDTQQKATERAYDLFEILAGALRSDPTLGLRGTGPGQFTYLEVEVAQEELEEHPNGDGAGYVARILWAVKVKSRI